MEQMTAKQAITRSICHDEIVHVSMTVELVDELTDMAEDWTETMDENGEPLTEFWGEDEDGNTWRVHVHE